MQAQGKSREDVEAALERVLARQDVERPNLLMELLEWFEERFGLDGASTLGRWLLVALAVVALVFLVRFLLRLQREWWSGARGLGLEGSGGPSVEERVRQLLEEAREARARGEARLALRKFLFALVLGLGRRGDLEFRDAWTYRELLARGNPSAEVEQLLTPLVLELEAKEFGRVPVADPDLDRLERLCRHHLGGANA